MHGTDFCRGAGGLFSGHWYLIRNLAQHVLEEDYGVSYPYKLFLAKEEVSGHATAHIQVADNLIVLQGGRILQDVIVPRDDINGSVIYH